jgi:EAL domain-containing protein (putative c-di-GMP-specific phosphodiesterase class I)
LATLRARRPIDRSFVGGVPGNERSEAITRAVVVLGKALHMRVVAEGVENHAQLDFLRNLGCDEVQGYPRAAVTGARA